VVLEVGPAELHPAGQGCIKSDAFGHGTFARFKPNMEGGFV
jgi:hypothetical protein